MPALPSSLALTSIADGSNIVAADHRNNYAAIQTAVNALIAALGGGSAGQLLQALSSTSIGYISTPRARVTKSGAQSVNDSTITVVSFDTEIYDTDTIHDNVTNNSRLTATTAGLYIVEATLVFATNATGFRSVAIRENATSRIGGTLVPSAGGVFTTNVSVAAIMPLNAGQYVECEAMQNSGGALNIAVSDGTTGVVSHFAMARIGA